MINPCVPDYSSTPADRAENGFRYAPAGGSASPIVTVITPFWNNSKELFHETARCVLGQSLQQFEWIIVNDHATDPAALAVLDQYRGRDFRIRVIDNPVNLGLAGARNVGFEAASTEFVFPLDDDDLLEPTALEKAYWHLQSHPEHAAVSSWVVGFGADAYLWSKGFECGADMLEANSLTSMGMIRRDCWRRVGGYDASIRGGLEDWDFWLRLADAGLWGGTIPEYLAWYRRRADHSDRWKNLDRDRGTREFQQGLAARFPRLYAGGFPEIAHWPEPFEEVRADLPCQAGLAKTKPRLLLLVPWLQMGGADKFNLDLVRQLTGRGWEISIATTQPGDNSWMPEFARSTPDIFILPNFLRPADYPLFLRHLIESRRPEVVMVTNSQLGYLLLPYLRAYCPEPAYVDYCHMEEEHWRRGGHPRCGVSFQELLDLNIVSSQHLKEWMVGRGADGGRIEICHTNIDPAEWEFSADGRAAVRRAQGIGPDQPVILYAARLCAQKKPQVLARVVQELARRGLDFTCLVAGNGDQRGWLESFLAENNLQTRVRMLGAVPNSMIKDLMSSCDIFFLPSQWEGIALSIYEAMACGRAVVGAAVGGQCELVTPDCGVLLPSRDDDDEEVQAYVPVLADLLRDSGRVREMGSRARERVCRQFTLEAMVERMEAVFAMARQRKVARTHPALSRRLALESAALAVELRWRTHIGDYLWRERDRLATTVGQQTSRIQDLESECRRAWDNGQHRIAELESECRRAWDNGQQRIAELEAVRDRLWKELQDVSARLDAAERERDQWHQHWAYRLVRRISPGSLTQAGNGNAPPAGA